MSFAPSQPRSGGRWRRSLFADRAVRAAVLFWIFSYFILTVRWLLAGPDPLDLASPKRAVSALLCSAAFLAMANYSRRWEHRPRRWLGGVLLAAVASACIITLARVLLSRGLGAADPAPLADEVRAVLLWVGYFLAALLAWGLLSRSPPASEATTTPAANAGATDEFWVQRRGLSVRVDIGQIDHVQAEGNYVRLHFDGTSGLMRASLYQAEQRLACAGFIRLHRSVLCRRTLIKAVRRTPTGTMHAVLADGRELPIGRRYAPQLRPLETRSS